MNHLHCSTSDHILLWIIPEGIGSSRPSKPFCFEEMWLLDKGCFETVETIWTNIDHSNLGNRVINKIDKCRKALRKWSLSCFRNVRRELELKRKQLQQVQKELLRTKVNFWVLELRSEVNDLLDKENRMWFQRSRSL